jgi:hypothetical protein
MLIVIAAVGATVFLSRQKPGTPAAIAPMLPRLRAFCPPRRSPGTLASHLPAPARRAPAEAAKRFRAIRETSALPAATRAWAALHQGLAETLAGENDHRQSAGSRAAFQQVAASAEELQATDRSSPVSSKSSRRRSCADRRLPRVQRRISGARIMRRSAHCSSRFTIGSSEPWRKRLRSSGSSAPALRRRRRVGG